MAYSAAMGAPKDIARNNLRQGVAALAKLNARNQLTLPKSVVSKFPGTRHFEVRAEKGRIVLLPARATNLDEVWRKIKSLGIAERDIEDAVRWARKRR
ncbi:MAG: AbrB/MazE/SpoVT family DNA-binding domain-containing protein [Betaproteobacteria bacterium]